MNSSTTNNAIELSSKESASEPTDSKPSRLEAEDAVRTLIRWAGDDPSREGLIDTPNRVIRAYEEFFAGYASDPEEILSRSFEETAGYDGMVLLTNVNFESHCEHHMVPIIGVAHVAYIPNSRVVGISKLARIVEAFGKRLQIQERLTTQIANAVFKVLQPRGVGVIVEAQHQCMTTRGVKKPEVAMKTNCMLGCFKDDTLIRSEFMQGISHTKYRF